MGEQRRRAVVEELLRRGYRNLAGVGDDSPQRIKVISDLCDHAWTKVDRSLDDVLDLIDEPLLRSMIAMEVSAFVAGTSLINIVFAAEQDMGKPLSRTAKHQIRNALMVKIDARLKRAIDDGVFDQAIGV
jgi:hypothetical protein